MIASNQNKHIYFIDLVMKERTAFNSLFLVVLANIALWLSAKVEIPFYPVPFTMQTLVVFAMALLYGTKLGTVSIATYLLLGAIGLPMFAGTPEKGIGIAYMMGPTGGYLLGFLVATLLLGTLSKMGWDRKFISTCAAMALANLVVYALGLLWLGHVIGWSSSVFIYGMVPFLLGDLVKIIIAAIVLPSLWKYFHKFVA